MGLAARIRDFFPGSDYENDLYFPPMDYKQHPEYKSLIESATPAQREQALGLFKPVMEKFLGVQATHKAYIAKNSAPAILPALKQKAAILKEDGIVPYDLSDRQRKKMIELSQPHVDEVYERRAKLSASQRGVEGVSKMLGNAKEPTEIYNFFHSMLEEMQIFELCHSCKKMPYLLKFVNLQINDYTDTSITENSTLENGARTPTFYMHVDSSMDNFKLIFYRTDSNLGETGAFRYVPKSYSKYSTQDRAIRKANDKIGLDTVHDIEKRKLFAALPEEYRKKANFGNDLLESHPQSKFLLEKEQAYGTDRGDMVLFSPDGIHRGNIFTRPGTREIFQLLLVPKLK